MSYNLVQYHFRKPTTTTTIRKNRLTGEPVSTIQEEFNNNLYDPFFI